jgi:GGDEF domain-containing protein
LFVISARTGAKQGSVGVALDPLPIPPAAGHPAGEDVLAQVVHQFADAIRPPVGVGRPAPGEGGVIAHFRDIPALHHCAERKRKRRRRRSDAWHALFVPIFPSNFSNCLKKRRESMRTCTPIQVPCSM